VKDWLKSAANVCPLLPPDVQPTDLLDDGGQGVVYRGSVNGTAAAVKFYIPGQLEERIEREVVSLGQLSCPSIVRLLWHGKVNAQGHEIHVVATELVEGETLSRALAAGRRLNDDELCILSFDVAQAIAAMWARRIVHRDLKPSNILLRPNGRACVIDLGLARHLDQSTLTGSGMTCGTLGYMSPEQCRTPRALSCHSDVFALGVLLIEAAAGHHPSNRDQRRLVAMGLHQALPPEIANWSRAALLSQMLDPRANCRPRPDEILEALAAYAIGSN
jgi:serine/threonine protein kinase